MSASSETSNAAARADREPIAKPIHDEGTPPKSDSVVKTDARTHTRVGWWLILGGLGCFLLWAVLAPLDKGVQEGDRVKAGDLLVRMNGVQTRANAEINRAQYMNARAMQARLLAERDGLSVIAFPKDILKVAEQDPHVSSTVEVQRQLFESRRDALRSELSALEQNIAGLQAFGRGIQESREGKNQQLRLLKEQVDSIRGLASDGYLPRNRLLEHERTLAQISASISEDSGTLGRNQSQIGELRLRVIQAQQEHQKELRSQLAEVQKEVDGLRSRLEGLEYEVANAEVKAPVDGMVAGVAVFTEGGVVAPGFRMMDIVPLDEPLVVEGQIPVHLIDSVQPGLKVELIFSAFNQNTTPRIPGVVIQISPDRLVDEKSGLPYYRLIAEATPDGGKMLATLQVKPGMPVDLFVSTGEHTMASYLLKPIKDHIRLALTEE
jgi:membrane fusion protein, protease secretion system